MIKVEFSLLNLSTKEFKDSKQVFRCVYVPIISSMSCNLLYLSTMESKQNLKLLHLSVA